MTEPFEIERFVWWYREWRQKRIKAMIEHYGMNFFKDKKVLELGCGYADIGAALVKLGAIVTAVDGRPEHIEEVKKRHPNIRALVVDLDREWPFKNESFDLTIHHGVLYHLKDYEKSITDACSSTKYLCLESEVSDSEDEYFCLSMSEDATHFDQSLNGRGSRPSPAAIERVIRQCGMNSVLHNSGDLNSGQHFYDWIPSNDESSPEGMRRFWFAEKKTSVPIKTLRSAQENRKRLVQGIIDYFGTNFFLGKKILELGCGHADVAAKFATLGAVVMGVDAREEHLRVADSLHPEIYYVCRDLDKEWPFDKNECFDLTIHMGLLPCLVDYEKAICDACSTTKYLVLETEVVDSDNERLALISSDVGSGDFGSLDGSIRKPSVAAIERVLKKCRMKYFKLMSAGLNSDTIQYNWCANNNGAYWSHRRRLWIAEKRK